MKIYHNPRCSKSRQTLALIKDKGIEPEIVRYLDTPPTKTELLTILELLGLQPSQLLRKGEKIYKERRNESYDHFLRVIDVEVHPHLQ